MLLIFLAAASSGLALSASAAGPFDNSKLIDLTHTFDEKTIHWPTAEPFRWQKDNWGIASGGYWYASASFRMSEHAGTHIDAPIHFAEGQLTTDQIPLQRLVGPAVVIDITAVGAGNPDYLLTPKDIFDWEHVHGRVPRASIVLVRTGWSRFWNDPKRYMGTDAPRDTARLHFPGISVESARLLVERRPAGVGIDTASLDRGQSKDFQTHRTLMQAGIYGLENLGAMDRLPATGATIIALPMKIRNGTGGPVRVIALLP